MAVSAIAAIQRSAAMLMAKNSLGERTWDLGKVWSEFSIILKVVVEGGGNVFHLLGELWHTNHNRRAVFNDVFTMLLQAHSQNTPLFAHGRNLFFLR